MEFPHDGFIAYTSKDKAKRSLRYFHDRGMEGRIEELTSKEYPDEPPLYGVIVIWPEEWESWQIMEFISEMDEVI